MATQLTCPKCQGVMRSYERNGIQIDQCNECRGIFLDRGELDLLLDAEAVHNQTATQPARAVPTPGPPAQANRPPRSGWSQDGHHDRRRKSFLAELFD